ncbi:MAG: hypothetical protein ABI775_10940 [Pseudonocardiales bacterium]
MLALLACLQSARRETYAARVPDSLLEATIRRINIVPADGEPHET